MASSVNFWAIAAVVTCVKFLFIPAYKSTDFEVHRNWLAITHTRPISKWYYEMTSEWTLDYPPLFAWFEYLLSFAAKYFDPAMLRVSNLNYASPQTVFFQRLSVIIADFVFIYGTKRLSDVISGTNSKKGDYQDPWTERGVILAMLLLWNPGLLMVDHIHFQYNGFLNGFLLLSIANIMQGRHMEAAFWFALLLNLKHLYLYLAPAYFIYLLRNYCFQQSKKDGSVEWSSFSALNFLKLGAVVGAVFAVSFGPFIWMGQLQQLLNRLLPFKRGLTHAYWAPNFWALYNTADKVASVAANKIGIPVKNVTQATMTGGLVKEYEHSLLPSLSPSITMIITTLSLLPALWKLWHKPKDVWMFNITLVLCAFGAFLFSWHVHEKAIIMAVIPLTILAVSHQNEAEIYVFCGTVGHFSLFPLLFRTAEIPAKILLLLLHTVYAFSVLSKTHRQQKSGWLPLLTRWECTYLFGLIIVYMYYSLGNKLLGLDKSFPFLPLMMISMYCAFGLIYSWLKLYILIFPNPYSSFVIDGKKNK